MTPVPTEETPPVRTRDKRTLMVFVGVTAARLFFCLGAMSMQPSGNSDAAGNGMEAGFIFLFLLPFFAIAWPFGSVVQLVAALWNVRTSDTTLAKLLSGWASLDLVLNVLPVCLMGM